MGRSLFTILFIFSSENNFSYFGFKIRNTCLSYLVCFVLSIIRAFLLTYYIFVIIPDIIYLYINTWFLNTNNWWISKSEPFFANESVFNAFICWIFWSYLIFILQIMVYIYLPLLSIVGLFFFITFLVKKGCGSVAYGFVICLYYLCCSIKNIIIGRGLRAYI
jgi:hypothetical protein